MVNNRERRWNTSPATQPLEQVLEHNDIKKPIFLAITGKNRGSKASSRHWHQNAGRKRPGSINHGAAHIDNNFLVMGQFDTEDNLTPRTIWHRPCKEDNLTPRTIWHRGQFDTIMQNRTIWHRPCREDNLTPRTIWHLGQFDTIINFIFLQLFGPKIWLEIYWLPLSIFLTENYPV